MVIEGILKDLLVFGLFSVNVSAARQTQKQCNVSHKLCACPLRSFKVVFKNHQKKVSFSCNLAGEVQTSNFCWNVGHQRWLPRPLPSLGIPHTGWGRTWLHRLYPRLPLRCKVESFKDGSFSMWVFARIVVPPNHPILIGISIINHPFWGYPYFWKHPCKFQLISTLFDWLICSEIPATPPPKACAWKKPW